MLITVAATLASGPWWAATVSRHQQGAYGMREDFNIKRVSTRELWNLTDLTLAQMGAEIPTNYQSAALRRAQKRLSALLSELKLRGVQLELDLRQRQ